MKKQISLLFMFVLLILVACTKEKLLPSEGIDAVIPTASRSLDRPLKGNLSVATVERIISQGIVIETFEGSGQFSHLGRAHVVAVQNINDPVPGQFNGRLTITAANKDQLFINYAGVVGEYNPATRILPTTFSFVVDGGTGRFKYAISSREGEGSSLALFTNFPPGPEDIVEIEAILDGRIGY